MTVTPFESTVHIAVSSMWLREEKRALASASSKHLVFPQRSEAEVHPQPCCPWPRGVHPLPDCVDNQARIFSWDGEEVLA